MALPFPGSLRLGESWEESGTHGGGSRPSAPVREVRLVPRRDPGSQERAGVCSHHLPPTAASQDPAVLAAGSRCLCVDAGLSVFTFQNRGLLPPAFVCVFLCLPSESFLFRVKRETVQTGPESRCSGRQLDVCTTDRDRHAEQFRNASWSDCLWGNLLAGQGGSSRAVLIHNSFWRVL